MTLTLSGRPKAPRRVTEASFESAFAEALRACGLENWHVNARDAGWFDRYVHTGIWIEFKVLERITDDQLEVGQKARGRDMANAGEPMWYCALLPDRSVILCRYPFDRPLEQYERFFYRDQKDLEWAVKYYIKERKVTARRKQGDKVC